MAERTEAPTAKRKHEAREKGQIAKTPELNTAAILLLAFALLGSMGPAIFAGLQQTMRDTLGHLLVPDFSAQSGTAFVGSFVGRTFGMVAPLVGALMLAGIVANVSQVGIFLSLKPLTPDFSRLNPVKGFSRVISKQALLQMMKASVKVLVIGWVAYQAIEPRIPQFAAYGQMELGAALRQMAGLGIEIGQKTGAMVLVLAGVDYLLQRRQMDGSLKMTLQELKEEMRESDGSPQMKAAIRQRQRQMARRRMMQDVPKADVVVTNPTHVAVALKYDQSNMAAPRLLAKGQDVLALRIKQIAREHNIPIVENPPLARAINKSVEVGMEIPADLYQAVASVLAFIYRLNEKRREARA